MKKLVFSIALFSAVAFVSCCNKESKTDAAQAPAAVVETVVSDTVVVDSTAVTPAEVVADSAVVAE